MLSEARRTLSGIVFDLLMGLRANRLQINMELGDDGRAFADGSRHPLHRAGANVTHCEHTVL